MDRYGFKLKPKSIEEKQEISYHKTNLELMTTFQLREICRMGKIIHGVLNLMDKEENGYYQYHYDSLNRLAEVKKDGDRLSQYEYDIFGNRSSKRTDKENIRYYYNALNQLIRTDGVLP